MARTLCFYSMVSVCRCVFFELLSGDFDVCFDGACLFDLSVADTQIVEESFLEDINNILNSGEVPGLFEGEDLNRVIEDMRVVAKEREGAQDKASLYALFIERVRAHLHVVLCMR